jgi:hypothetical protein
MKWMKWITRTKGKESPMSDAAALPPPPPGNGTTPPEKEGEDVLPKAIDEAALDEREAALDVVLDQIDEALPRACERIKKQRANSRLFVGGKQERRTRAAFLALSQAAAEASGKDSGSYRRLEPDDDGT